MVQCKEEVFDWFKNLSGATRIELMCGLLNLCIPLEWRFFATVIENLARRDYASLKDYEVKANSTQELDDIANSNWLLRGDEQDKRASTTISTPSADKQQPASSSTDTSLSSIRSKIVVYMCLLSSSNRVCATLIHKSILKQLCVENLQQTFVQAKKLEKMDNADSGFFLSENLYNEIILLHTLARFHPAFTFEQQTVLGHQLQFVQNWMDAIKFTVEAASGTIPARHALSNFQQHLHQYQQTQQFHHPFQSTNKQQHPQYHHQMQQQQYCSHLHPPNDFNPQIANLSLPNNTLSVLPPCTPQLTVASPPGFENQSLSPGVSDYSPMVAVEQKSGRKDVTKDSLLESDEELMRGVTKELRSMSFGDRVDKDSSIVTNGDLNEYKKSNLDNSKPNSPVGSICSSSSSSPVSSVSNSLNGAIVSQQHSTPRHVYVENLLKKEHLRKYREKVMNINPDELWNMSEDDFVKLGLTPSAALKLNRALLNHANYNGMRLHNTGEADISDSLPQRSLSPISPPVSLCSEKGFDGVGESEERVATYLKTADASGSTRTSSGAKTVSNQKWAPAYNKAVPNASVSTSSVSTLASTNKQQTASKSSSLSSVSTGSETSAKASKTLELNAAGSTGSNRVQWKSVHLTEASAASVNKCANCGSSNCICSVSNGSSVATTPSSTPPPPSVPTPQMQPGMVHMAGGQVHPYWLFLPPPPPFPATINGYTPGSHSELFNWYTLAVAAASAGMSCWPHFPSLAFPGSIPGFPSTASVHGGNQSLMAGGNSQSKVSCYNCGGIGHRGNECSQQSLDDVVKPSTFNMNFTTPPEFDTHVSSHTVQHSTYPNQASHMQSAPHTHQASYHYSTSPPHNFQEHSAADRSTPRHGTHPHT